MSSTFNQTSDESSFLSVKPKVMIDTKLLYGAIGSPGGINERILTIVRASILFTPVLSKVCLLEFKRNAINGLGNAVYSLVEVESYINGMLLPILDDNPPVNSAVGR